MFQMVLTATNVPHTDGILSLLAFLPASSSSLSLSPYTPPCLPFSLSLSLSLYALLSLSSPQFTGAPLS